MKRVFDNSFFRWGVTGIYVVGVTFLSLLPSKKVSLFIPSFLHSDKVGHAVLYGGLAFLLCWALRPGTKHPKWLLWAALVVQVYGALMELMQLILLPRDRFFSWGDMAANSLGAMLAVLVYWTASAKGGFCEVGEGGTQLKRLFSHRATKAQRKDV